MIDVKERDPIVNLALELLDDPLKKEALLYLICYFQLVRREGKLYVELDRFLACAYRSFRNTRSYWKDILVELSVFQVIDLYGMAYSGKDIYKLKEGEIYLLGVKPEYEALVDRLSTKVVKLWNVLSRSHVYHRSMTIQDAVAVISLLFNEGLYEEVVAYGELCMERYKSGAPYFSALINLSLFYMKDKDKSTEPIKHALSLLDNLGPIFCGVNISKLSKDIEDLIRKVERGKEARKLKVEFVGGGRKKENILRRVWNRFKKLFDRLIGKDRDSYFIQGESCTKSFRTPYISL